MHFVYILKCFSMNTNKSYYYRGYTNDINRRFIEHKTGKSKYTKRYHGDLYIIYIEEISGINKANEKRKAIRREKVIKKWSREKIEKIVKLKQKKLEYLMEKYFQSSITTW